MGIFQKIKKIFIDSFLPIFAGVVLISGIIYAWNEPTAPPPSGSGVLTISQGNVGIGTANPTTLKGTSGYLDVKDVFMRDVGRWASDTGSCICRLGNSLQLAINCGSSWQDLYSSGGVPIAYFRCSQNVAQFGSYLVNAAHTEDNCTGAGGTIQADGSNKFCKFTAPGLPPSLYSPDSYTKLLLHADGTGATFVDSETTPKTITASGNATQSATQSKFGGKSAYFDGTGDYLSLADSSDFAFSTGDLTIDFWVYCPNTATGVTQNLVAKANTYSASTADWMVYLSPTGKPTANFWAVGGESVIAAPTGATTILNNSWTHIAVVRSGSNFYIFVNGVIDNPSTTSAAAVNDTAQPLELGRQGNGNEYYTGYLDEVRVSKGVARWTSNFSLTETGPFTCPTGWTQYNNWSATSAKTCIGVTDSTNCPATSYFAAGHTFANIVPESGSYYSSRSWVSQTCTTPGSDYYDCGWFCCDWLDDWGQCAYYSYCCVLRTYPPTSYDCSYCADTPATCYADITARGCY